MKTLSPFWTLASCILLSFVAVSAFAAAPTITGRPPAIATVGQAYSFAFTVADSDTVRSKLSCVMQNKPDWLSLSYQGCSVSGTPKAGDVGMYSEIRAFVKDGANTVGGTKFSIAVQAGTTSPIPPVMTCSCPPPGTPPDGPGVARLSWKAPTQNTDGSALTNLAGYRIVYGLSPIAMNKMVQVSNPSLSAYIIEGLPAGKYYFAVRAYTTAGIESPDSNIASKTLP